MPIHTSGKSLSTVIPPVCPDCAVAMALRHGAYGDFWGCTNYPKCKQKYDVESWARELEERMRFEKEMKEQETFEQKTQRWIREMWNEIPEKMSPKEIPLYNEGDLDDNWGDKD